MLISKLIIENIVSSSYFRNFLLTTLILQISSAILFSANYTITLPNGNTSSLKSENINGKIYILFRLISEEVFPGSVYNEEACEIYKSDFRLKVAPASFFVLKDDGKDIKVSQMTLPALNYNGNTVVPLESFFKSLDNLNLFRVNIREDKIVLSSVQLQVTKHLLPKLASKKVILGKEIEAIKTPHENLELAPIPLKDNDSDAFRDSQKAYIKSENYIFDENDKLPIDTLPKKAIKPDYYIIPEGLIRRDLDKAKELKKKSDSIKSDNLKFENYYYYLNSTEDTETNNAIWASLKVEDVDKVNIIDIFAVPKETLAELHIVADGTIEVYHRPEFKNNELILRIPDVSSKIRDFSNVFGIEPIESVRVDSIRNFLLIKIKIARNFKECLSYRNGSKEIIYQLYLKEARDKGSELKTTSVVTERKKWNLNVIVLDPGHGGHDHGALSISGYKEKDIALRIAKKVKKLIKNNMPATKVVMTREDDSFVELYKRGQIANQNEGKLFISIHLNSMPKIPHSANGIESYILKPGRNEEAIRVANRENEAIKLENDKSHYKELTSEELIVATMAQSAFVKFSEMFAKLLQEETATTTSLANRGVNQAGFYVLVGASMPNVLFEAGFLSNVNDEKFITSETGINKIANGVFNAIKKYSIQYQQYINGDS